MHRLGPGSDLHVRGPSVTWWYRPQDWDEVVFVSSLWPRSSNWRATDKSAILSQIVGGTGITPAYQFANDMLSSGDSAAARPAVSIVYASPSPSRIILEQELDELSARDPEHVKVHYLVDRPDPAGPAPSSPAVSVGLINRNKVEQALGQRSDGSRRAVIVCGPDGCVPASPIRPGACSD